MTLSSTVGYRAVAEEGCDGMRGGCQTLRSGVAILSHGATEIALRPQATSSGPDDVGGEEAPEDVRSQYENYTRHSRWVLEAEAKAHIHGT